MRCERAKMAIFLWLAPRPALAGSYLLRGEAPEKSAILNAAKIGVLTWCTRFCYTYWEHQCLLYYANKQNWYKDASIFRPPACLVLIRRCGAQQSHTCPQRRHVRQKGGERYGAFLRLGRSRGRCPRPLVGFSAWRRGTRGHPTAARQRRRQAPPPKRRTGPSALPPRRRAACPQQRR